MNIPLLVWIQFLPNLLFPLLVPSSPDLYLPSLGTIMYVWFFSLVSRPYSFVGVCCCTFLIPSYCADSPFLLLETWFLLPLIVGLDTWLGQVGLSLLVPFYPIYYYCYSQQQTVGALLVEAGGGRQTERMIPDKRQLIRSGGMASQAPDCINPHWRRTPGVGCFAFGSSLTDMVNWTVSAT